MRKRHFLSSCFRGLFIFAFLSLFFSFAYQATFLSSFKGDSAVFGLGGAVKERLKVYKPLPSFHLLTHSGTPFTKEDLLGKVTIANFVFTTCQGPCPLLSAKMSGLQKELPQGIQFVSFSVDPEHDTAEKLTQYAHRFQAQKGRWFFVRGEKEALFQLIREGFLLGVEEGKKNFSPPEIMHTTRFVLVDRQARIRGYYSGNEDRALAQLKKDALWLHSQ